MTGRCDLRRVRWVIVLLFSFLIFISCTYCTLEYCKIIFYHNNLTRVRCTPSINRWAFIGWSKMNFLFLRVLPSEASELSSIYMICCMECVWLHCEHVNGAYTHLWVSSHTIGFSVFKKLRSPLPRTPPPPLNTILFELTQSHNRMPPRSSHWLVVLYPFPVYTSIIYTSL